MSEIRHPGREETPVTDVRAVREDLHARYGWDLEAHAQHSNRIALRLAKKLGLKLAPQTKKAKPRRKSAR